MPRKLLDHTFICMIKKSVDITVFIFVSDSKVKAICISIIAIMPENIAPKWRCHMIRAAINERDAVVMHEVAKWFPVVRFLFFISFSYNIDLQCVCTFLFYYYFICNMPIRIHKCGRRNMYLFFLYFPLLLFFDH